MILNRYNVMCFRDCKYLFFVRVKSGKESKRREVFGGIEGYIMRDIIGVYFIIFT